MIDVLSSEQVRLAEKHVIDGGVNVMFLRYNAALAVADATIEVLKKIENAKVAVFCGAGGNGYDGLIVAARLGKLGYAVTAYLAGDKSAFNSDALNYIANEKVEVLPTTEYSGGADVVIDAVFGIGLNRALSADTIELINRLNAEKSFRIAVDIPSGLHADSGEILGAAFDADMTVTFSCYKTGMLFGKGKDVCGKIKVCDVGIKTSSNIHVFDGADVKPFRRKATAHKGSSGRVFVIGGCGNMIGAPMLAASAAHAAYLNGAGTVTVCVPAIHKTAVSARVSMAMMKYMTDTADGYIKFDKKELDEITSHAATIVIGMGMGGTPDLKKIVMYLSETFDGVLVIDADALNAIKLDYGFLKNSKSKIVLTPHVGEFERLTGEPATVENAVKLAENTGAIVALKSSTTVITDGKEIRLNISGTPAMAKGGMGDVLGGCIAALSCAYDPIDAVSVACYRNGMGAERAVSAYAQTMLTAKDVLDYAEYDEI